MAGRRYLGLAALALITVGGGLLAGDLATVVVRTPGGDLPDPSLATLKRLQTIMVLVAAAVATRRNLAALVKRAATAGSPPLPAGRPSAAGPTDMPLARARKNTSQSRGHMNPLAFLGALAVRLVLGPGAQPGQTARPGRLLALSLLVPWLLLVLGTEPGHVQRLWWLWPLQVAALAAFVTELSPRLLGPMPAVWLCRVLIISTLIAGGTRSPVDSWLRTGWSGLDAEKVQVVADLSRRLHAEGKQEARIGYQVFILWFMAGYNVVDPRYKVGADFDLLFRHSYGISNTNRCPEGVSPDDEYRIVQTRPGVVWEYFDVPLGGQYRLLQQFGLYQVYRRE
ncbi:MAG: hypothetical protein HY331_18065 [Chloroflexi bacterium]|nr:hypothetical protein [Chloroflexota bacterium]